MIKKTFRLGIKGLLLLGAALPCLAAAAELHQISLSAGQDTAARVSLHLSGQTEHNLFTLENPNRIVVDLSDTRQANSFRVPDGAGIVQLIRTGKQPGNTLRVVFETSTSAPARAQWVGDLLVIDVGSQAAAPLKAVRAIHAPAETDRDIVVAVDAGHGGRDPGATGRGGTREKDVVLAISRALVKRINSEPGMRAVLTRDRDEFVDLWDRLKRARNAKADLFISVHADAIPNRKVSGASVYVLSDRGATDEAARWLAERENAALMGGISLDDKDNLLASVLLDLSQAASISASMVAAERVLASMDGVVGVRKPRVQQAGFVVLKSPDIPSMLVETAFISNPGDEARLKTRGHQAKLANAIFAGIRSHFDQNPPPGTRFAQARRITRAGVLAGSGAP